MAECTKNPGPLLTGAHIGTPKGTSFQPGLEAYRGNQRQGRSQLHKLEKPFIPTPVGLLHQNKSKHNWRWERNMQKNIPSTRKKDMSVLFQKLQTDLDRDSRTELKLQSANLAKVQTSTYIYRELPRITVVTLPQGPMRN